MDRFLNLSDENKIAAFNKAETEIGFSEDIIEKDFNSGADVDMFNI